MLDQETFYKSMAESELHFVQSTITEVSLRVQRCPTGHQSQPGIACRDNPTCLDFSPLYCSIFISKSISLFLSALSKVSRLASSEAGDV